MKDYEIHLETLHKEAAETALIRDLATVSQKRELFAKLTTHLNTLAAEVERAMAAAKCVGDTSPPTEGGTVPRASA